VFTKVSIANLFRLFRSSNQQSSGRRSRILRFESLECRDLMTAIPAAPNPLVATAVSSSQVNLNWHLVSGANGYIVDEYVNGAWKQIGVYGNGTSAIAVGGLNANTTYYFDVAAYNSAGANWANYAYATTRMAAPAAPSLLATAISNSQINLNWNSVPGATGYLISEWNGSSWQTIGNFGSGTTAVTVSGLNANATYYFEVGAYNSFGTTWSNIASAATRSAAPAAPTLSGVPCRVRKSR
jgi:hypothetical protein